MHKYKTDSKLTQSIIDAISQLEFVYNLSNDMSTMDKLTIQENLLHLCRVIRGATEEMENKNKKYTVQSN